MNSKFDSVKVLESRVVYEKHGRPVVVEDLLEFADGSTHKWVYFKGKGRPTVVVAALTEDNKMILAKQYRHPLGRVIYDLPAGGPEGEETTEQAALRELEEETGYTAEKLEWIGRFSWAPGAMAGMVEIFFTKSLKLKGIFDRDEIVDVELMDFDKVLEKVLKGEFVDSALVIVTLLVLAKGLVHS